MERLQSVLEEYLQRSRHYNQVSINEVDDNIVVKWFDNKGEWYQFEEIEFPKNHLDMRIEHYKNKIR